MSPKTDKKQIDYAKKYDQKLRRVTIHLHRENDADLVSALEALPKGQLNNFIKQAIRQKIEKT